MRISQTMSILEEVKTRLTEMGLGHLPVDIIQTYNTNEEMAITVTHGEGFFGKHIEPLNKYFSTNIFMMYFEGRKNYLALSQEEKSNINVHPQQWEAKFIAHELLTTLLK
jgi:phosphoribosylformylglycinamidine (FGAM) synthase-like amidotransferase family enzyme